MKRHRTMTLASDVEAILTEVSTGRSSASAYIQSLVLDADREWRACLEHLRSVGWRDEELCAVCDVLNGFLLRYHPGRPATDISTALIRHRRETCDKWQVQPTRWSAHAATLSGNETDARCVLTLVRERWRMNPRLEQALGLSHAPQDS